MASEEFEREKICYEHNAAQMRALNAQMGNVPTVAITLTGGLWFAASQAPLPAIEIKFGLLIFAAVANIGLALSCFRIRDVLQSYLEKIREFAPQYFADGRPERPTLPNFRHYSMIMIYAGLMISASVLSLVGAFCFYWPFHRDSLWIGIVLTLVIIAATMVALLKRRETI